ncbi:hypothetical protein E8E12_001683 [Didymella heteroderae]|uniref:Uncharacterized protein n=1 Tax=Didymella heteroderae TaxID=1769908 RepID=A0A9P4WS96_9PLEO|nr:hypothetical protein E8E12_001683 [Didymella heteroderae]
MTDEQLQRLTAERDAASGEERKRLEGEVGAAEGRLEFQRGKKERQRQRGQRELDGAVAPKPLDGALYSSTGRRAEGDRKTEFEGWAVLPDSRDEEERKKK